MCAYRAFFVRSQREYREQLRLPVPVVRYCVLFEEYIDTLRVFLSHPPVYSLIDRGSNGRALQPRGLRLHPAEALLDLDEVEQHHTLQGE